MKAMALRRPNTPFESTEVPDPVPGAGEAAARVLTCGSGLTIQHVKAGRGRATFPRIIGHEITGEIARLAPLRLRPALAPFRTSTPLRPIAPSQCLAAVGHPRRRVDVHQIGASARH